MGKNKIRHRCFYGNDRLVCQARGTKAGNLLGISISRSFRSPTLHETFDRKLNLNRCRVESNAPLVIYFVANSGAGEGMPGLRTQQENFALQSRWLNNQLPDFLRAREEQRFIAAAEVRSYIYVNCYWAFWKAVNCKIRLGIRLHLLVTRLYAASPELTYRASPLIR